MMIATNYNHGNVARQRTMMVLTVIFMGCMALFLGIFIPINTNKAKQQLNSKINDDTTTISAPAAATSPRPPTLSPITVELNHPTTTTLSPAASPPTTPTTPTTHLLQILEPISGMAAMTELDSPQQKAVYWLSVNDPQSPTLLQQIQDPTVTPAFIRTTIKQLYQRYIAAVLYFTAANTNIDNEADGDKNWTKELQFLSVQHVCDWNNGDSGIFCTANPTVIDALWFGTS
jgi:hypothetical protein